MARETLEKRVKALEAAVGGFATVRDLEAMQSAISQQILQLGHEMHAEFSAVRHEIRAGDEETRRVLREETHALLEQRTAEILALVAQGDEETRRVLREEIRAGDEETRTFTRALHEDVIDRIKQLGG
ncbi:MAG: hypothetical protein ACM3NQ_23735 [Bacteroidales bacterium]